MRWNQYYEGILTAPSIQQSWTEAIRWYEVSGIVFACHSSLLQHVALGELSLPVTVHFFDTLPQETVSACHSSLVHHIAIGEVCLLLNSQ